MNFVPVRQRRLKRGEIDGRTRAIIRRVRKFLVGVAGKKSSYRRKTTASIFASVPSEVKQRGDEITVIVPILGFTALELYVFPDWDSLVIEGRVKERRELVGSHGEETIEKRLSHRLRFDFTLDPNRITATMKGTTVEIIAFKETK